MPAFESRRVRTQPLTVTGTSLGAWPERISRTLNSDLLMGSSLTLAERICPVIAAPPGPTTAAQQLTDIVCFCRTQPRMHLGIGGNSPAVRTDDGERPPDVAVQPCERSSGPANSLAKPSASARFLLDS